MRPMGFLSHRHSRTKPLALMVILAMGVGGPRFDTVLMSPV